MGDMQVLLSNSQVQPHLSPVGQLLTAATELPGWRCTSKVSPGTRQKKRFSTKLGERNSISSKVNL